MDIDQRIEALTQRTDALTQSVELLSQMHQDNEKRFMRYFETISESLKTLTRIADSHENRLNDHQTQIDKLKNRDAS